MSKQIFSLAALLAAGVVGGCVGAGASHVTAAHAADNDTPRALTVFVDATVGFRKDHMAAQITDANAEYEAKGYHFVDMEAFNENGDLQGFFVTYARN